MNETSRLELDDQIQGNEDLAGLANLFNDADPQEEDAAQVSHLELREQGDAPPDEVSNVEKQSATSAGLDGPSVVSVTAEEAEESGEALLPGWLTREEATDYGSFDEVQIPQEAGSRDSEEAETCGEPAAGEATGSSDLTDVDSALHASDAPQSTCLDASAVVPGSAVEANITESCKESDAVTPGLTLEEAGESREEPSENVVSESEPANTESSWFSGLVPVPVLGPEEIGMASVVSTVESWLTSAFGGQEAKDKKETLVDPGSEDLVAAISGSSSTLDSPRTNEQSNLVPTEKAEPDRIGGSAHVEAEPVAQTQSPTCSSPASGVSPSPRILLHLCEQPEPIVWSASERAFERDRTSEGFEESSQPQEDDSRFLHVPLPRLLAEAEGAHEPAAPQRSLDQLAEGLERWILDGPGASAEAQDKADGSVCSSDSDEDTGERLFDLARVTAYFMGNKEADQASTSDDPASSLAVSARETGSDSLSSDPPSHVDETASKEAVVAPTELAAQGSYISALRTSDKRSSPLAITDLPTFKGPVAEEDDEVDDAAQSAAGSDTTAEECDTLLDYDHSLEAPESKISVGEEEEGEVSNEEQSSAIKDNAATSLAMPPDDISCELTPEEAEAKEASIRSLGNRIWAFFGGKTAAEEALSGSERPTSSDAVEETIQFEDPAVVQRDDHRAFPNETQLLLESIKQNSQLQVLSPQQQKYVASLMRREVVAASTPVAEEGAEPALMWCSSGEFDVTQAGFFGVSVVRTMTVGDFFGVEELIAGEKLKCALTPRPSANECVLWILDKELFVDSVKDMLAKRVAFVPVAQAFLHMVPLVRDLPEEQIAAVAKACKVERFAEGQTVFKMGFHGDMLCFIYSGEAITQKPQDDGDLLELARQGRGEYFGEMALIRNARRTASVVAGTELLLLCLDKDSFETLLAPLKEKMAAKAASSYKRQDDAPPTESEPSSSEGSNTSSLPSSRAAGEACVKKRTRKSSLALLNYSKIRDQEKQTEEGHGDSTEEKAPARWRLAQEPEVVHEPPPSTAVGGRSCLKGKDTQSRTRARKSLVRFDESSLLPSESSSEDD